MKVFILEDELPAYEKLAAFIQEAFVDVDIVAWARSISEALHFLEKGIQPDLIFSDIELLDGHSFEVFQNYKVDCPIIFCTAFDQYLFQAFKTNGIAYLLKPYDRAAFKEAIDKYKSLFANAKKIIQPSVLSELKMILESEKIQYKKRFSIKKKGGIKLLNTADVVCFKANGDFCFAYDNKEEKNIVNFSLSQIESKVDPSQFFRINRSEIINIEFVDKIETHFKNKLLVRLLSFDEKLYTSSTKTREFRLWLEK